MSKENRLHPNLSSVNGTFSQVIEENSKQLSSIINDGSNSFEDIKSYVLELLESCKETPWVRGAIRKVENFDNKNDLVFYVYNSFLSGENLKSI